MYRRTSSVESTPNDEEEHTSLVSRHPPPPNIQVTTYRTKKCITLLLLLLVLGCIFIIAISKEQLYYSSSKNSNLNPPYHIYHRLAYGESDDLSMGKSCIYNQKLSAKYELPYNVKSIDNYWTCQDCSIAPESNNNTSITAATCQPLKRRGRCRPFPTYLDSSSSYSQDSNKIPRVYTSYSPYTSQKSVVLTYHHDGQLYHNSHKYIPKCSALLSLPCFDLSRCTHSNETSSSSILKVYSHGGVINDLLDYATQTQPTLIQRVYNASEACLLVLGLNAYNSSQDIYDNNNHIWNHGQNHYIFEASRMFLFDSIGDRPIPDKFNFEMASSSRSSLDDAWIREGYDLPTALSPRWKPPDNMLLADIHRPRRYLLSFKGNVHSWEQRNYQHRWIAAEYWHDEPDVHVDTKCESSRKRGEWERYNNTNENDYGNLLLNSTFFFCPGGGGVHSFRFSESLLGGAIPVVTSDFIPPFYPDIDWSGCIIQVSDARVVDIPRLVREISDEEVKRRQIRCNELSTVIFGNMDDHDEFYHKQLFTVAMMVWHARINSALKHQGDIADNLIKTLASSKIEG